VSPPSVLNIESHISGRHVTPDVRIKRISFVDLLKEQRADKIDAEDHLSHMAATRPTPGPTPALLSRACRLKLISEDYAHGSPSQRQ
jgi:hypothetical protein